LKIAIRGQAPDVKIIRCLLAPWHFSFTNVDEADIVVVYKTRPAEAKKTIVIPSSSVGFFDWIKENKSKVLKKTGGFSKVRASETVLTIKPDTAYWYDGLGELELDDPFSTALRINEDTVLLTIDVVREQERILDAVLEPEPSILYRLLTNLPISYNLAPKPLREMVLKERKGQNCLAFCEKLPFDALRLTLVSAIEKLMGKSPSRKMWNGKKTVVALTHDVETQNGLRRSKKVKRIEHKYDAQSAWYVPSKMFELDVEAIRDLANHGEVGAHDTKHDGKLVQTHGSKLIQRMREAKQTLEKLTREQVTGFRSPLLQHSAEILGALRKAGYAYDTSIPTWEPRHPYTMKSHGVATTYPFHVNGLIEIPVTLPQDHQLLYVLGLRPKEVVREWMSMIDTVKELGGVSTILMHPDYELADPENLGKYEELLNAIISDNQVMVSLPKQIACFAQSY
jgi:peptidoglycan/xylan/chitin deacetylase (PgdA/CDA1 family)